MDSREKLKLAYIILIKEYSDNIREIIKIVSCSKSNVPE